MDMMLDASAASTCITTVLPPTCVAETLCSDTDNAVATADSRRGKSMACNRRARDSGECRSLKARRSTTELPGMVGGRGGGGDGGGLGGLGGGAG